MTRAIFFLVVLAEALSDGLTDMAHDLDRYALRWRIWLSIQKN